MVGELVHLREKGRRKPEFAEIGGLAVTRCTLYDPPGLPQWRLEYRLRRAERTLVKAGTGRVLLADDFPYRDLLRELRPVDPLPFWRAIADLLALSALEQAGIRPERGRVALSAPRLCPELRTAAERLCPRVRGLVIDAPGVGEDYARWLHLHFGLPVTPISAGADVTVAFGPGGGRWGRSLELYGQAKLDGLAVTAEGTQLPEDCRDQVLALLWERGALDRSALVISGGRQPPRKTGGTA